MTLDRLSFLITAIPCPWCDLIKDSFSVFISPFWPISPTLKLIGRVVWVTKSLNKAHCPLIANIQATDVFLPGCPSWVRTALR